MPDYDMQTYISPWLILLLRIMPGIDAALCVSDEPFRISLHDLLFESVCRNTSPSVDDWIMNWFENATTSSGCAQSGAGADRNMQLINLIRDGRAHGRDIFCCFVYGGGSYDGDKVPLRCITYGRDRGTARMFCESPVITAFSS
ncbi:hypothetical protein K461DRAFT_174826 [Myriangium duriaei CBS 260.36]|uniref:Secreted protein n=1 Tax=Myriangium duriaei CBS 260.36 TaxID=1168546 RepID=A0A9P4IVA4_9PEZI|nr:hypothetical protein K461DRAFT_174826 [Myriangium duriaei CBS 260.36]